LSAEEWKQVKRAYNFWTQNGTNTVDLIDPKKWIVRLIGVGDGLVAENKRLREKADKLDEFNRIISCKPDMIGDICDYHKKLEAIRELCVNFYRSDDALVLMGKDVVPYDRVINNILEVLGDEC
jgi:hypothetical protein